MLCSETMSVNTCGHAKLKIMTEETCSERIFFVKFPECHQILRFSDLFCTSYCGSTHACHHWRYYTVTVQHAPTSTPLKSIFLKKKNITAASMLAMLIRLMKHLLNHLIGNHFSNRCVMNPSQMQEQATEAETLLHHRLDNLSGLYGLLQDRPHNAQANKRILPHCDHRQYVITTKIHLIPLSVFWSSKDIVWVDTKQYILHKIKDPYDSASVTRTGWWHLL